MSSIKIKEGLKPGWGEKICEGKAMLPLVPTSGALI